METEAKGGPASFVLRRRGLVVSVLLIALAVFARFGAHLSMDAAIVEHDWYTMHSVDALHVQNTFEEGQLLPTWSPWVLGGSPLWGVSTKPFSYPPFLFAVWSLGAIAAMNALLLLHAFLGGVGCMLLAKRMNLLGPAPLLCGLLFVLARFPGSGFQATPYGFGYAITWWPFFLIALLDLLQGRGTLSASLRLAVFAALQWHAGGQPSLYWLVCFSLFFALPILMGKGREGSKSKLAGGTLLALLAFLGLIAVKLLPELAWLESSGREAPLGMELARDSALEEKLLNHGRSSRLLNLALVLVEQYGGGGGLILILGSLVGLLRARHKMTFWATALATGFVFVLASGALHEWAYEWLPNYDRMRRHSRFVHMAGFGWILLAAHGLQFRLEKRPAIAATGALVLFAFIDTTQVPGVHQNPNQLRSSVEQRELFTEMIAPVLQDERLGRLQQAHRAQADWTSLGIEGCGGALGGPSSGNRLFHEFLPEHAGSQTLQRNSPGALDVMNVRYLASDEPIVCEGLELVLRPAQLAPRTYKRLKELEVKPLFVFHRETARPRICAVDSPTLIVGPEAKRRELILGAMQSRGYRAQSQVFVECPITSIDELTSDWAKDFPRILFIAVNPDDPALAAWTDRAPEGELRSDKRGALWMAENQRPTRLTPLEDARHSKTMGTIDLNVQGIDERLIVVSERTTLDPGWSATVDGNPLAMLRADGLVTLLRLPPGARKVRMQYTPPGRSKGMWISCLTVLLIASAAFQLRRRKRTGAALNGGEQECTG